MIEFRIYYECLEQALHFIHPIFENNNLRKQYKITLVRNPKSAKLLSNSYIQGIFNLFSPDILISVIKNNQEFPVILFEFSEAVSTEDHELQRTYGGLAGALANCFYIKISGDKLSINEFGKADYNPYTTPKIFKEKIHYHGYIIAKWAVNASGQLVRNSENLSCPNKIDIIDDVINQVIYCTIKYEFETWFSKCLHILEKIESYKNFNDKVMNANSYNELLSVWKNRYKNYKNFNKKRYFVTNDQISAKINRFDHAMDPDRGILTFISTMFSDKYKIFGIYALTRYRTKGLETDIKNINDLKQKLEIALNKDGCLTDSKHSILQLFSHELIKKLNNPNITLDSEIDFTDFILKNKHLILTNKVFMTLACFLDGIKLNYNGCKVIWDRNKLFNHTCNNFIEKIKVYLGFNSNHLSINSIKLVDEINEDEVTYSLINNVLKPNHFKILSVSYPGAQGSEAILPDKTQGKRQERKYPDVIATLPNKPNNILLNESKGLFKKQEIETEVSSLNLYKTNMNYRKALSLKVLNNENKIQNIIIGVSFGVKNTKTTWEPHKIDFAFILKERKEWVIGLFNQELKNSISNIEGLLEFPMIYKVVDK